MTGLQVGKTDLDGKRSEVATGRTKIVNHPNGGPVFSGPQVQPWVCQATAVDDQCNEPP